MKYRNILRRFDLNAIGKLVKQFSQDCINIVSLGIYLGVSCFCIGQEVVTLAKSPHIQDGIFVDPIGNVYTTSGGLVEKTTIGMYSIESKKFEVISNQMKGSIDIVSLDGTHFFVTNYDDNSVKLYNKDSGVTSTFAAGFDGPAGIEADSLGNIYVTNFGVPPLYKGNSIYRISSKGEKELFIKDERLKNPQGIAWYNNQELLVSNSSDGEIFLIDTLTRKIRHFTNTGESHSNMTIGRGGIFLAANKSHRILKYDFDGDLIMTYGSGIPGVKDGVVKEAQFANPIGLAFSPDEKKLYVSQIGNGFLRCIVFKE